jgi:hypothetical protein
VDFKTGATEPDPLQLAIYRQGVEEIWNRRARAVWFLLRDDREETAPEVAENVSVLRETANRLAEAGPLSASRTR